MVDDIGADSTEILMEMGRMYAVTQQASTNDSYGEVTAVTDTTFNAYGMLQDINKKDREIHDMGLAVKGNTKGFFKPSYYSSNTTYTLKEDDILTDDTGEKYRLIKIIGERGAAFIVVILQSINLEGTQ